MNPKFDTMRLLVIAVIIIGCWRSSVAQDDIPSTPFEAIVWLEKERNTVKRNSNGDVVEIVIDYVPDVFVIGDL